MTAESERDPADRRRYTRDGGAEPATVTVTREPGEQPSHSVIRAVASVTGLDPITMRPLYDVIDPDALNRVFEPKVGQARQTSEGSISFRFNECDVTVHVDGRTVVSATEEA